MQRLSLSWSWLKDQRILTTMTCVVISLIYGLVTANSLNCFPEALSAIDSTIRSPFKLAHDRPFGVVHDWPYGKVGRCRILNRKPQLRERLGLFDYSQRRSQISASGFCLFACYEMSMAERLRSAKISRYSSRLCRKVHG